MAAQPDQLDFRHYTVDDGLPSSEVYTTFQDREGFIWIGTDNGIARFDGYEFIVFDKDDGLEDMVVFTFLEDPHGRLWASTYSGRFFYFEEGCFHPYVHNSITQELKKNSYIVELLDVTEEGDVIVHVMGRKVIRILRGGEVVRLTEDKAGANFVYLSERSDQRVNSGVKNSLYKVQYYPPGKENIKLQVLKENTEQLVSYIHLNNKSEALSLLYLGALQRSGQVEIISVSNKKINITTLDGKSTHEYSMKEGKLITYVLPGKQEGEYWYFFNRGHGVERHIFSGSSDEPQRTTFLNGHSTSSGLYDRKGGFWITTLDDGIYYCPYPNQKLYLKEDVRESVKSTSLVLTGPESFYAGYDDGSIFYYEEGEGLRVAASREITYSEQMSDMFYDSSNARIYTPFFTFKHPLASGQQLSNNNITRYAPYNKRNDNFENFNYLPELYPGSLFATNSMIFAELNLSGGAPTFHSSRLGIKVIGSHVLAADANGRRFLGTLHGLYEVTPDGRMVAENLGVPELSGRVVHIKTVNQDALLFGTRGNGLVYFAQDTSYLIKESDGLASDMIRNIHEDSNGVFWISTLNGLSKIAFSENGRKYDLRTFRTNNGLPTNEVSQTKTWGDAVWLATSAGIVHFTEPLVDSISTPPTIRKVLVNGTEVPNRTSYDLPASKQAVSIHFGTINFALGAHVHYRYRIAPIDPWQYSYDRTANFPNLGQGTYQFAVQSCNNDGYWSKSTLLNMYVAPPWYATWWAITLGMLILLGTLSSYFLIRERRHKREQDFLIQINELEHAAMHAQMNPHFVFNALNSIQNFVLQNDAKQAATYLSRFARIIRQTLHSSVEGKHTLREEVDMLGTYLVLEKLRFKDGFNYELTISPELDQNTINLPPLLIQPFVENAIIHGLKGRKRGGWISIDFAGSAEILNVRVEDNGKGFDPNLTLKNDSMGMDITRRRLGMMNQDLGEHSGMKIEPLHDDQGHVCGTQVTLRIKLENPDKPVRIPNLT